jgi:hypothetical protein
MSIEVVFPHCPAVFLWDGGNLSGNFCERGARDRGSDRQAIARPTSISGTSDFSRKSAVVRIADENSAGGLTAALCQEETPAPQQN